MKLPAPDRDFDNGASERLSQVQERLAKLMGEAMQRGDEDPRVYVIDRYGGRYAIGEIRLDWVPETVDETDADVRHPIIEFLPPEEADRAE